ncbi:integrase [Streptomyces sp. NPDC002446]
MTREELLALPVAVDLDTANKALTIGRSTGYALAKRGEYPVAVLRLGNAYRVVTEELHRLLGVHPEQAVVR